MENPLLLDLSAMNFSLDKFIKEFTWYDLALA